MSTKSDSESEHGVGKEQVVANLPAGISNDAVDLEAIGYKPVLTRPFGLIESFASSFCAMNFIGVTRTLLYIGLATGGPAAMWSSSLIHIVGSTITAAVLAEICSALPLSGSIYIWASEAAGAAYGRLAGFMVAWWACTAWISFVASNSQAPAQFLLSLMTIFDYDFPSGLDASSTTYRGVLFAVSLGCMWIALGLNYLPPKWFAMTFRVTVALLLIDFFLLSTSSYFPRVFFDWTKKVHDLAPNRRQPLVRLPLRKGGLHWT
ncbi:hypothetical protein DFH07DRAFT_954483 [Mycena maculata]|uniref:Amino acid transporter n=1 Tax=Mycena maculata TaxID=230809 RepID=A0AAD7NNA0_9AGAR|nr:hypothetical protein DFH07DRAFT_954483 [Mycena maculata]